MTESTININGIEVDASDLSDHVQIYLFRQMTAAIDRQTHALEKLEARLELLESLRDQQAGAKALVEWIFKHVPWLFAGIAAFAAGLNWKGGHHP